MSALRWTPDHLKALSDWAGGGAAAGLELRLASPEGAQVEVACTEVLRWLPGRRLVCRARMGDEALVAKWFLGRAAARHAERERRGVELMTAAGVRTPALAACWRLVGPDTPPGAVVALRELAGAEPLTDAALERDESLWSGALELLARLHAGGLVHLDLHFGNLLRGADSTLWMVDGDGVRDRGRVDARSSLEQFCLLCAQARGALDPGTLQDLWQRYCGARGWAEPPAGPSRVEGVYRGARRERLVRFQAKTRRECSAYRLVRGGSDTVLLDRHWLASRNESADEFVDWVLGLPEVLDELPLLKRGNTATVASSTWHGERLVLKRYNNKSAWHRLRRWLRRFPQL